MRPDWEYHEFAGAGHVPMLEVPAEFVDVVSDWLMRHAPLSRSLLPAWRPASKA